MARHLAFLASLGLVVFGTAAPTRAQEPEPVLLVIDAGSMAVNASSVGRAIAGAIDRPVVRMTDERARSASGRLTIAFSDPDRWVLHYESRGRADWTTERIEPSAIRVRLAELSADLVSRVEASAAPAGPTPESTPTPEPSPMQSITVLRSEIIDPFEGEPRPRLAVSLVWSEVVDPFGSEPRRAVRTLRSEVLDPWSASSR